MEILSSIIFQSILPQLIEAQVVIQKSRFSFRLV